MTIQTTSRVAGPFASSATTLPFNFKVYSSTDLRITRKSAGGETTVLDYGTHYSVTLNADQDTSPGGWATLSSATPAGSTVTVTTAMPALQSADITNMGGFYPEVIEDALDKLTILAQQQRDTNDAVQDASQIPAVLQPLGPTTVQAALNNLWQSFDSGWLARVNTEAAILAAEGDGTLLPNRFYRSTDTDKIWFALAAGQLLPIDPQMVVLPGGGEVTTQAAFDAAWDEIAKGWKARVAPEMEIGITALTGALLPNWFYRSSDTNKLWFALSTNKLLPIATASSPPPPKVVVIGDSMAAQHPLQSECWPELWAARMRNVGAPVTLVNLSVGGWTYNKANTLLTHGGNTMIQEAVAQAPDMVIVNLGANDQALRVENRTLAQAQADANTALNALRAGLPNAVIIVVSEYLFDSANFPTPGTTLKNKGVIPSLMQKRTSGLLQGVYSAEILDDSVSAQQKTNFADWVSLDNYARGHSAVNGAFSMRAWRAARLGTIGLDGTHFNQLGQHLLAGYALVAAQTVPSMKNLWPRISADQVAEWRDPDALFSLFLTASGDGYTQKPALSAVWSNQLSMHWGGTPLARSDNWWAPSGGSVALWPQGVTTDAAVSPVVCWRMVGCLPLEACSASIDGAAFNTTYGAATTDPRGDSLGFVGAHLFPAGNRSIRYKIGNEVFGPYTLSVGTAVPPSASGVSASLATLPAITNTQQALDQLWTEIGSGYQARVGTEAAIQTLASSGQLFKNHLYRSSDTNKVWLALETYSLGLLTYAPPAAIAARLVKTGANQLITNTTAWQVITLDALAETKGAGSFSGSTYTVPSGGNGRYVINFCCAVQRTETSTAPIYLNAAVDVNGTQRAAGSGGTPVSGSTSFTASSGGVTTYLYAGDQVRMSLLTSVPVNVSAGSSNASTYLSLIRVSID